MFPVYSKMLLAGAVILTGVAMQAAETPVVNLLRKSYVMTAGEWTAFSKEAVVKESSVAGPAEGIKAFEVKISKYGYMGQVIKAAVPGHTYRFTIWMKSLNGARLNVTLACENNPPGKLADFKSFPVTGEWQKFTLTGKCPESGNQNFRFSIRGCEILAAAPEVVDVTP